ncbi:MAG: hypothetical protein ABIS36_12105 [Chryseolinea sp.]
MLIRKNTKAFKTIKEIIITSKDSANRQKIIRLYITRAGHSIKDRINVESIKGDAELFYNLNYDTIINNLESSGRQLYESDDVPGIYFFNTASNKNWDETPFEFDDSIRKEFSHLGDLPAGRKKEKVTTFVLTTTGKSEVGSKVDKKIVIKTKEVAAEKSAKESKQPSYGLKHRIEFTDLEKVAYRRPYVTRKDILDYYSKMSEYLLPHLKERPLCIRAMFRGRNMEFKTIDSLPDDIEIPDWIQTTNNKPKEKEGVLTSSDKDHLLLFVDFGGIEFNVGLSKVKTSQSPDCILLLIESPGIEIAKAVEVAMAAKTILDGLHLPSFVKSDGQSGFHIYTPLDSKSEFKSAVAAAEYLCKLIKLKCSDLVALEASDDHTYEKVSLEYSLNDGKSFIIAPYSLVRGEFPAIAVPLLWDELNEELQLSDFNIETIAKRLKQVGDPFENLSKKKANADELLQRLEDNYGFLF